MRNAGALRRVLVLAVAGLALAACGSSSAPPGVGVRRSGRPGPSGKPGAVAVPRPRHVVVVIMENHAYGDVIGSPQARYLNSLARTGALFTASYGVTHPSEPNYLALFSGSTHGVTSDQCPTSLHAPNLAADLISAGLSFAGYAEGLPATGSQGLPARRLRAQARSVDRLRRPAANGQPAVLQSSRPADSPACRRSRSSSLTCAMTCTTARSAPATPGCARTCPAYAAWAQTHDSLLIVTFDEDDGSNANHITTIFTGQQVRPGRYRMSIDHYNVLRTIEQAYGLPFRRPGTHSLPDHLGLAPLLARVPADREMMATGGRRGLEGAWRYPRT